MRWSGWFHRIANVIMMTLAGALVAWLSFIDPIQQYLNLTDGGWLAIAGLSLILSAGVIGAAGAAYYTISRDTMRNPVRKR
jgi:hypothetical protein